MVRQHGRCCLTDRISISRIVRENVVSIRQKSPDIRLLTDSFCYSSASQGQPSLAGHAPLSQTVHRTVWEIHPVPGALRMEISPSAEGDQGLMVPKGNHTVCKQTVPAQFSFGKLSGSLANRGPRKPLKRLDLNFLSLPTPLSAKHRHSLCALMNHRAVGARNLRKNKLALSTRRVHIGCYYYDRADCEAGATAANWAARAPRHRAYSTVTVM